MCGEKLLLELTLVGETGPKCSYTASLMTGRAVNQQKAILIIHKGSVFKHPGKNEVTAEKALKHKPKMIV